MLKPDSYTFAISNSISFGTIRSMKEISKLKFDVIEIVKVNRNDFTLSKFI